MNKQIKALKLAIKALEKQRRQHSAGHVAFHQGIDFTFAIQAEKNWHECDNAISQLADLIEILEEANAEIPNQNVHTAAISNTRGKKHEHTRSNRAHGERGTQYSQPVLTGFDHNRKPDKGAQ